MIQSGCERKMRSGEESRVRRKGHDFHQLSRNPVRAVELIEGKARSEGIFAHFSFELWKVWQRGSAMAQEKEVTVVWSRDPAQRSGRPWPTRKPGPRERPRAHRRVGEGRGHRRRPAGGKEAEAAKTASLGGCLGFVKRGGGRRSSQRPRDPFACLHRTSGHSRLRWARTVKRPSSMRETGLSPCRRRAPHSSTLAWKAPCAAEPGGPQSAGPRAADTTGRLHCHSQNAAQ